MIIQDRVYGEIKIEDSVIEEIIKTKEFQRLKEIDQAGYPPLYYNPNSLPFNKITHNRFEHSVGVYFLLKKFGASKEEQISGLIHDISHSAFSHCIDYVFESGSEKEHNYQDNIFKDFAGNSNIPVILEKNKLDVEFILEEKNFKLLERSLPDLCADRVDYSLRSGIALRELSKDKSKYFLDNLIADKDNWIFKDFESAKKYGELFLRLNVFYFSGIHSAIMFRAVGDTLKYTIEKGYISKEDLYTTDAEVINKIKENLDKDEKLKLLFNRMNNKVRVENDPENYDAHVFCKSRIVDPLFKDNGKVLRLSEKYLEWKTILEKESKPKEYFLKFKK